MADYQIINKINIMIINFIDNIFDIYKSDFEMQYTKCINHELFVEFATHDFLFCTILHGEIGGTYDIRKYHANEFKIVLNKNLNAYARIVSIVDTYFKNNSHDACQKIEEYKPETILKYYTFVFVKLNETLFLRKHSPFAILDDSDTEYISDDECY